MVPTKTLGRPQPQLVSPRQPGQRLRRLRRNRLASRECTPKGGDCRRVLRLELHDDHHSSGPSLKLSRTARTPSLARPASLRRLSARRDWRSATMLPRCRRPGVVARLDDAAPSWSPGRPVRNVPAGHRPADPLCAARGRAVSRPDGKGQNGAGPRISIAPVAAAAARTRPKSAIGGSPAPAGSLACR